MTPAEHWTEMERWLRATDAVDDSGFVMVGNRPYHASVCLARAQVHATAATVNPDVLWPKQWALVDGAKVRSTPDPECICPRHDHEPLARLATFPACPVHGSHDAT